MPYNPGVTDRSGEILGRSISQAGENIGSAIEKTKLAETELEMLRGKGKAYADAGMLTPEDYHAMLTGNLNKARGIISQADAGLMARQKQQQMEIAQQGLVLDQRGMAVKEGQLAHDVERSNNLGRVVQGRLSDGTIVDINPGTGQVLGGVQRTAPAPNNQNERFIKDPATGKTIGYQVWNGRSYSEPHNVPAPNAMDMFYGGGLGATGAAGGAQAPQVDPVQAKIQQLQLEYADHKGNMAAGDKHYGFANMNSRETRMKEIEGELAALTGQSQAPQVAPSTATIAVQPNAAAAAQPAGVPRVGSQAEYNALPSGAEYINAKTGQRSRKP